MPISFTPVEEKGCWSGSTWTIDNEDELAKLIARVAIGQSRTVERILRATGDLPAGYPKGGFEGARQLLTVGIGTKAYHRDGWVFQVIAWIAAHRFDEDALIRSPQMIKADKGLDGLMIEFDDNGIAHIVICEEKATQHPRQKVKSEVWPEFKQFETGARDNELIASVTSLLEKSDDPDPDQTVADILWKEKRAYRVAVTVGEKHASPKGRKQLFKGYEDKVLGGTERRRAETLVLDDVRKWLDGIAKQALAAINEAEMDSLV